MRMLDGCRWVAAAALVLGGAVGLAQSEIDVSPGLAASRAWLATLDAGRYGQGYEDAAQILRDGIPKAQWETGLERARGSLGVAVARKLRQATCSKGTRADPEAEICVVQYDTQFERRPLGDEQVTLLRGADGKWRVAAYQLR